MWIEFLNTCTAEITNLFIFNLQMASAHLSEALEILDSFEEEKDFKKELGTRISQLKSNKKFKKQKDKHLEQLKNKHGLNKVNYRGYSAKPNIV